MISPVDSLRLPCVRFSRGATAEPATPSSPVLVVGFTRSLDAAFALFDERKKHPRRTYARNTHPLEDVKLESEPDGHRPKDLRKSAPCEQLFLKKHFKKKKKKKKKRQGERTEETAEVK